jgi:hypothetical protein
MEGGNHAAGALNASPCRPVPSCLVRFPEPQPPALERPPRLSIGSARGSRFASVVSSKPPRPVACWDACAASVPCPRRPSHGRTTCAASPPVRRRGARARRADEVAHDEGVAKRGVEEDCGADRQVQEREDALLAEGQGVPLRAAPERVGARYASRALASVRAKRASLRPRRSLSHGTRTNRLVPEDAALSLRLAQASVKRSLADALGVRPRRASRGRPARRSLPGERSSGLVRAAYRRRNAQMHGRR